MLHRLGRVGAGLRNTVAVCCSFGVAAALLAVPFANRGGALPDDAGVIEPDFSELDDGHNHLIVEFAGAAAPVPASVSAGSSSAEVAGSADTSSVIEVPLAEVDGRLAPGALDAAAARGRVVRLERRGGTVIAVVDTGAVDAPVSPAPGSAVGSALAGGDDPGRTRLEAVAGTVSVEPLAAGTWAVVTDADAAAYETLPGVVEVRPDVPMALLGTDDHYWPSLWHLDSSGEDHYGHAGIAGADIGVEDAWVVSEGEGVVVAVIDSGVDFSHPELAGRMWTNTDEMAGNGVDDDVNGYVDDARGWDFRNNDNTVMDRGVIGGVAVQNRHGTHVAGIIAAAARNRVGVAGVAPRATIMNLKVTNHGAMYMNEVARAVDYAVANGADIINLSLGTVEGAVGRANVSDLERAIGRAGARGVVVVAAAGNSAVDIDVEATWPASLPDPNLISVAASDNRDARAAFTGGRGTNHGRRSVHLAAPGWKIVGLDGDNPGGYITMGGTSMAAAMVSGAAALIRSAFPGLLPAAIKAWLTRASMPTDAFEGVTESGDRLDIGNILNPAGTRPSDPVTFAFDGFAGLVDGDTAAAVIRAGVDAEGLDGANIGYRATLLTDHGGAPHGVIGAEVATAEGNVATDDEASVALSPAAGFPASEASRALPFGFSLPAGSYALVAEAYTTTDGRTVGRPWAVYFAVAAPGEPVAPPITVPVAPGSTPTPGEPPTTPIPGVTPSTPASGSGAEGSTTSDASQQPPGEGGAGADTPAAQSSGGDDTTSAPTPPSPSGHGDAGAAEPAPTSPPSQADTTPTPPVSAGGGGAAPTTPSEPGGGSDVTSTPSAPPEGGTTLAAPPLPPVPGPVTNRSLTVASVSPRHGSTTGRNRINIIGRGFRGTMHVRFGSTPGTNVTVMSRTWLRVTVPSHVAVAVDVTVSIVGGESVTVPAAYSFRVPDPVTGFVPTPGTPPAAGATPTTPSSPGGQATAPTTTLSVGGTNPAATPSSPSGGTTTPESRFSFGSEHKARGLRLRPVTSGPDLPATSMWAGHECRATSCPGVKV